MQAIAYTRVSTDGQGESGLGLDAQRTQVVAECERRGWTPQVVVEVASARTLKGRPVLSAALDALDAGEAQVLVVTKVDRVGRSLLDVLRLAERAEANGWHLVVLEANVDTSTPQGRFVLQALGAVAELERGLIAERTKAALRTKRAQGARLGRPVALPLAVRERIAAEHDAGRSLRAIAAGLTADGVPTAQGGAAWHASTVRNVLRSLVLDAQAAAAKAAAA
jgi:DNA invertase Pin-like site-specific DNA recombinase